MAELIISERAITSLSRTVDKLVRVLPWQEPTIPVIARLPTAVRALFTPAPGTTLPSERVTEPICVPRQASTAII